MSFLSFVGSKVPRNQRSMDVTRKQRDDMQRLPPTICSYYSNYGKEISLERLVQFASDYWYIYARRLGGHHVDTRAHTLLQQFLGSPRQSPSPYKEWFYQRYNTFTIDVTDGFAPMSMLQPGVPELAVCLFGFTYFPGIDLSNQNRC
jgi:hypothetical protein